MTGSGERHHETTSLPLGPLQSALMQPASAGLLDGLALCDHMCLLVLALPCVTYKVRKGLEEDLEAGFTGHRNGHYGHWKAFSSM